MTEQQTPVMEPSASPAPPKKAPEKKKKHRKLARNIIITVIVLALLAGAAFLVYYFIFAAPKTELGDALYDTAYTGSISSIVQGGGSASAKDSKTITLSAAGIVQDVFVAEGQVVNEGDPLYVITSAAAEQALANARESLIKQQESMAQLQKEMADLQKSRTDLTILTPHAGKLTDVAELHVGDQLSSGSKIAVLVDDTRLKLSLYYSYAYENDIAVGQTAQISIPATMTSRTGTVEKINKVERITPEGGVTFEVIFVLDNPGTLTAGMTASAELYDASGSPIYPYESGAFSYYQTTTISAKADGPVDRLADLMNYANVSAGQTLVVQGTHDIDTRIQAKQDQITEAGKVMEEAVKKVEDEQKNLDNFSAVAPITGTVVSCAISPGQEVDSGLAAVTISDNTVMTVKIDVDERNVQYIKTGMMIDLSDWNGNSYMGTVESVAAVGNNENGVTVFPAVVKVDNSDGRLLGSMYLDYRFTAAQSDSCIVIPIQDVRYITLEGDDAPTSVVYLQTDTPPDNAIDRTTLSAEMQAEIPKDCAVVPVVTGLSDDMNVEIKEGLQEGDMVFNNFQKPEGSWGRRSSGGDGAVAVG